MKSLKKFLRSITFISLLFAETGYSQYMFTPFENESSFKGAWNLSQEVPNYIAAYLREFYKVNVLSSTGFVSLAEKENIPSDSYSDFQTYAVVANKVGFTYVVTGKVDDFTVDRFSAGESNLAGYEAYSCNISISLQVYDLSTNSTAYSGNVESSISNRGLGVNLFGIPSDGKKQYLALNNIRFGSEEFHKTIVGETIFQLCEDLATDIKIKNTALLRPQKQISKTELPDSAATEIHLNVEVIKGQILTLDETSGEAFINLGSYHKIKVGDELSIYSPADSLFDPVTNEFLGLSDVSISSLEIVEIRGEKLALAVIKKNLTQVRKGLEVRKLVLRTKE